MRYKLEEAEGGSQVLGEGLLDLDGHRALCSSSLPRPPKAYLVLYSYSYSYHHIISI